MALVALGGAVGSLARASIAAAVPAQDGWPVATALVNVTGAFLLSLLLIGLGQVEVTPGREQARLLLGTGVLGGYTTYSALALETERLLTGGHPVQGLVYIGATIVAGLVAAALGAAVARRVLPGPAPPEPAP